MKNSCLTFRLYLCLTIVFVLSGGTASHVALAQGPSLTAGVSEVAFHKGDLDAQLIAQIIATKQAEVKTELAQRLILRSLENGNYATYSFVNKTVNLLLTETNKEVITKKVLQYSAELLMVYGFAEYYLAELRTRCGRFTPDELTFLTEMAQWADLDAIDDINSKFCLSITATPKDQSQTVSSSTPQTLTRSTARPIIQNLPDLTLIQLFTNPRPGYSEWNGENIAPAHILVDMIYEILRKNDRVSSAGFLTVADNANGAKSSLLRISEKNSTIHDHFIGGPDSTIWKGIDNRVNKIFQYYNTFLTIKKKLNNRPTLSSIQSHIASELAGFINTTDQSINIGSINTFKAKCDSIKAILLNPAVDINGTSQPLFNDQEKQVIHDAIVSAEELADFDFIEDVEQLEDYRLYLEDELLPQLSVLNTRAKGSFKLVINKFKQVSELSRKRGLFALSQEIGNGQTDNENFVGNFEVYFLLVDVLNNLNYVESYDEAFRFLGSLSNAFGNAKTKAVVEAITKMLNTYAVIDPQANKLTLDVESMAVSVFKRFGENNKFPFGMYFSVGINTMMRFDSSRLTVADTLLPAKFGIVSEKIGVRYNIRDESKRFALGQRDRKPLFNDIHALAYVSGLLYQIEFLTSNDAFKSPIYGLGLGATFFNGLGVTASWAVPVENKFKQGFWSVGFDIRITEYLGALKTKKALEK